MDNTKKSVQGEGAKLYKYFSILAGTLGWNAMKKEEDFTQDRKTKKPGLREEA